MVENDTGKDISFFFFILNLSLSQRLGRYHVLFSSLGCFSFFTCPFSSSVMSLAEVSVSNHSYPFWTDCQTVPSKASS